MKNTADGWAGQVLVKVFGFGDAERHALNTVFRLSQDSAVSYTLWTEESPHPADIMLVDGENWEARVEMARPLFEATRLIWVGDHPPAQAWQSFSRPVKWNAVIDAMDQFFGGGQLATPAHASAMPPAMEIDVDFDLDLDLDLGTLAQRPAATHKAAGAPDIDPDADFAGTETDPQAIYGDDDDTAPAQLEGGPLQAPLPRVLLADTDRDTRLYLIAKLASAGLYRVDEAEDSSAALALADSRHYQGVILDLGFPGSWRLLHEMRQLQKTGQIGHLIVTSAQARPFMNLRARLEGAGSVMVKPFHPARLMRRLKTLTS